MRERSKQHDETLPLLLPRTQTLKKQSLSSGIPGDIPGVPILCITLGAVYLPAKMSRTCKAFPTFRSKMVGTKPKSFSYLLYESRNVINDNNDERRKVLFHNRKIPYNYNYYIFQENIWYISSLHGEILYSLGKRIFSLLTFNYESYRSLETITRCLPLTKKVLTSRGAVTGYSYRCLYQLDGPVCYMYVSTSKYRSAPYKLSEPRV